MKKIGLIGGMSWESTLEYYRIVNEEVKKRLGGLHSARVVLDSVNFDEIEKLQNEDEWGELGDILEESAQNLERAGADCVLICTNTMHKCAEQVAEGVYIPLIHLADATGELVQKQGLKRIGLLGTKYTMEQDFYKGRLVEKFGLDVIVPDDEDREVVHRVIYDELCLGNIRDQSKRKYLEIIKKLVDDGVGGIILGCTEIPLLVKQEDVSVPVFDTTYIHAISAVDFILNDDRNVA